MINVIFQEGTYMINLSAKSLIIPGITELQM